jgi:hypothetical protein
MYILENKDIRGTYISTPIHRKMPIDDIKLLKGESDIDVPIKFGYLLGKNIYDLVSTSYATLYLLSDRTTDLLREHKITGWKTYPAILYDRKGDEIKGYSIFSVTGRSGDIDWSKSEKFIKDPFVPGGRAANMLIGLYPHMRSWDGSDVFLAEGRGFIFITKRVRDLLVKHKVTNILLTKVTEFEIREPIKPEDIDEEAIRRIFKLD